MSYKKKRVTKKLIIAVILIVIGGFFLANNNQDQVTDPALNQTRQTKQQPTDLTGKYMFSGTIVLARAVERDARGDYHQPFSGLYTFEPEQFDAWMADLECPVTTTNISYQYQINNLVFNCPPEFLPSLAKYFKLVNLAGNHTRDMGVDGFEETVDHLQKAGIVPVGNYSPRIKEDICEVVALPIKVKIGEKLDTASLPVAFCAWHYFTFNPEEGEIELIKDYAEIMPVFAFIHAGPEYYATAHSSQVQIARGIIDNGAEFVIGNSPHWVQNSEAYKGKLIVYSTGNFIFDQIDYETKRGVSVAVNMQIPYDDNVGKWLDLSEQCQKRHDNCLDIAKQQGLKKVDLTLGYQAIGNTSGAGVVTKKADDVLQRAIEARLQWDNTLRGLY